MGVLTRLIAGLIFGLGLVVSGMSDPAKVQNFLDIFGRWDPSLAFVMGGAVVVTALGYRFALARPAPLFDKAFHLPSETGIDTRLLAGSALFGLGWGLSGFCPGPAVVAIPLLAKGTLAFVPAMLVGLAVARTASSPKAGAESEVCG